MQFITILFILSISIVSMHGADDWEAQAQQRIRQHRMGDLQLTLFINSNEPAANATVTSKQTAHAFSFGTAVNAKHFSSCTDDDPYRKNIKALFNCAVLENGHKWPLWERSNYRPHAIATTDWLVKHGIRLRGHTLIWQTKQFGKPMPKDVWNEILAAEEGKEANLDYVRQRIQARLTDDVQELKGQVFAWDVTNELTAHHHALKVLDPDNPPRSSPLLAAWYKTVHAYDPGAQLCVNDYDILVANKESHRAGYEETIQSLLDAKAPLHGIGMQAHVHGAWSRPDVKTINTVLDRFARFNLPIWITEFDTFGKGWGNGEERLQAETECFKEFFINCFAHPAVEGFLFWGFWDGRHWCKNAPLFEPDWTPKPALAIYKDLVFKQWWSNEETTTDEHGKCTLRLFKGTHELEIVHDGKTYSFTVTISNAARQQVINLKTEK